MFGIVPLVIPSLLVDVPIPIEPHPARSTGTDLEYLQQLADDVGYVFYVEPGPVPGTNIAYWGPEIKVGVPQPALNVNMDAHTNVESPELQLRQRRQEAAGRCLIQDQPTKALIPIPLPTSRRCNPPLGLDPAAAQGHRVRDGTRPSSSPVQAAMIGLAKAVTDARTR